MKANLIATGWFGAVILAAACTGCAPRTVQHAEVHGNSAALANLGPKVGTPPPPALTHPLAAPNHNGGGQTNQPYASVARVYVGDPRSAGTSYLSNFDQSAARFDLKNAPPGQSKFPAPTQPAHRTKPALPQQVAQKQKAEPPATGVSAPVLPDLPDEPAVPSPTTGAKIAFLQLPTPRTAVLPGESIPLPPELPNLGPQKLPGSPTAAPQPAKPIPILLSTAKQAPPAPATAKASTSLPLVPANKIAPPQPLSNSSVEMPPQPPPMPPELAPIPVAKPNAPATELKLPDQPPVPPELPPAPVQAAKPIHVLAQTPPAPVSSDAEPQHISEPASTTRPGKGYDLPPAPPLPAAPAKVMAPITVAPAAPAPLPNPLKNQTEEPPPLLLAKPLPINGLQPVSKGVPGKPAGDLATLHQLATESYATIESYIVRFRRREQVSGKDQPEELMLFKYRTQPSSVYFKWLAGSAKGREVVYVKGKYGNKLHTLVAAGDIPLIPAGKRIALGIDSSLVRAKSRHSISDAGIGHAIEQFGTLVDNMKNKDHRFGSLKYLGLVNRPEFDAQVEAVLQVIPPKTEAELPKGGKRFWYFDTKLRFPVLLITFDEKNHEVEYYCYDRWLFPGRLSDDEFNPHVLWKDE
jgi:hypothetical protein